MAEYISTAPTNLEGMKAAPDVPQVYPMPEKPAEVTTGPPSAIKYLEELFAEYDEDRKQHEQAWNKWSAMFRGVFWGTGNSGKNTDGTHNSEGSPEIYKSRLYVNETKQAIVSAVSNVMDILFQKLPPFTVIGFGGKLDDIIAKPIKQVVWFFMQLSKFETKARRYVTQCAVYGTTYAKVHMDKASHTTIEYKPIMSRVDSTLQLGSNRTENTVTYPIIKWSVVDIFDMWDDPTVSEHTDWGRGVFHRVYRSKHYVQAMIKQNKFKFVDMTKYSTDSASPTSDGRDQRRGIVGLQPLKRSDIQLVEFWGNMPIEEATSLGIENTDPEAYEIPVYCLLITKDLKNFEYLLATKNQIPGGATPFIKDIWEDVGEGSKGRGIPENCQGPQMALNVTVNTRLDNKATAIQQIIGVVEDALVDPETDLTYKQNWVLKFKNIPDIRQAMLNIEVPDITTNAYVEAKEFARIIEEQSGILKYVQGTESYGSNRTASGISTVYQAASKFIRDITRQIEFNLIGESCRLIYKFALKFLPDEFLVLITDDLMSPEYRKIALKNLAYDVDFLPMGVQGLAMKEIEQSQMIQYAQGTANPVDLQIMGLNGRRALHRAILTRWNWKEVDEILPENPIQPPPPPSQPGQVPAAGTGPTDVAGLLSQLGGQMGGPAGA